MREIRSHLTYANVISTLALFLVLGGGTALASYVVSSNSEVGPGTISGHKPPTGEHANIVGGSINAFDLATGAVTNTNLAPNAVTSGKVLDNSLTGADINESALGKVPSASSADTLGGKTAAQLEGARAYAVVYGGQLCGAPVSFCPLFRSKGVAYAAHVGLGDYCVGVSGIDATDSTTLALVTPDHNSDSVWATWRPVINGGNVNCVGSEFEVQTGLGQNGVNANFTIVIP